MEKPTLPPPTGNDTSSRFWQELEAKLAPLEDRYLHWDELQHKSMPVQGINHKQWWQLLKAKRRARLQPLPFKIGEQSFYWVLDDDLLKLLTHIERELTIILPRQFPDWLPADNFINESIATSQLADSLLATLTGQELLCSGRPEENTAEQTLEAIYQCLSAALPTTLTPGELLKLNRELLNNPQAIWRSGDYQLEKDGESLYTAPPASEITLAIQQLCEFANQKIDDSKGYLHPILKAIILHYMLAAIHPFADGNGRTARALFYWQMLTAGYHFMQVVSLSQALLAQQDDYFRAFLLAQTDSNDLTYFLMQQLTCLQTVIANTKHELQHKTQAISALPETLTLRQRHVLAEMQQHPERQYRLARYQQRQQITYETSRTDLMKLAKHGFAKKHKIGKAFVYQKA